MNSSSPRISVIVPTYNSAKYIEAAIDSMLSQRLAPAEIIVSDDGSCDDTLKILEAMQVGSVVPIHVHANPSPSGITNNYLHAAALVSSADLIAVADHDDVWLPDRLSVIAAAFAESSDTMVVCCDSILTDQDLNSTGKTSRGGRRRSLSLCRRLAGRDSLAVYLRGGLPWAAHALSFRSSLLPLIMRRPPHIPDWYFEEFVVAVGAVSGRVLYIPEALTLYRQHAGQTTKKPIAPAPIAQAGTVMDAFCDLNQQRIEKIRHCRSLLQEQQVVPGTEADARRRKRLQICEEALDYCRSRKALHVPPASLSQFSRQYLRLVHRGYYVSYGRGVQSMAADLMRYLRVRWQH